MCMALDDTVMDFPFGPGGDTTYPVALWREKYDCERRDPRGDWSVKPFLTLSRVEWTDCAQGQCHAGHPSRRAFHPPWLDRLAVGRAFGPHAHLSVTRSACTLANLCHCLCRLDVCQKRPRAMKFTLSWLKDHLDTDASVDEIAEALTDLGLEVEEIVNPADRLGLYAGLCETCRETPGCRQAARLQGGDR